MSLYDDDAGISAFEESMLLKQRVTSPAVRPEAPKGPKGLEDATEATVARDKHLAAIKAHKAVLRRNERYREAQAERARQNQHGARLTIRQIRRRQWAAANN